MTPTPETRRPAQIFALACAVFIVYGSLFPFDFRATDAPFSAVFDEWNPFGKISDAIDNVTLFVPFGAALFFACRSTALRVVAALVGWLLLGVVVQVVQLYVPQRVASMADAINNAVGLLIGLGLARAAAPWVRRRQLTGRMADPLAWLLVGAWVAYEAFPFVPTLDIGLLAAHIKPALGSIPLEPLRFVRHALACALGTFALLSARPLRSRRANLAAALALLLAAKLLVPYGDLRLEALAGIVAGVLAGDALQRSLGGRLRGAVLLLAGASLLMTVVTPFRGPPIDGSPFTLTPFSGLFWQGSTSGIPIAAFEALSLGALMWAGSALGATPLGRRAWHWPAGVLLLVVLLEGLRLLLASGPADSSTLVMALVFWPFAAAAWHRPRGPRADPDDSFAASRSPGLPTGPSTAPGSLPQSLSPATVRASAQPPARPRVALLQALAVLAVMTTGFVLLRHISSLPYNFLQLLGSGSVLKMGLFSAALLWVGAGPWWVARRAVAHPLAPLWLPLLLAGAALFSLLLLYFAVPARSLDDVAGSNDLYRRVTAEGYWGAAWASRMAALPREPVDSLERGVRYVALYAMLLVPLTMAVICADRGWRLRRALPALAALALCWWLAKLIVIDGAITDNLVELIAPSGLGWLALLALMFSGHVAWIAARPAPLRVLATGAAALVLLLPAGWWLLKQGLEQVIVKYDVIWSAQQFLLGHNRTDVLSDTRLFLRWSAVYTVLLCVCAIGMALARRATAGSPQPAARSRDADSSFVPVRRRAAASAQSARR